MIPIIPVNLPGTSLVAYGYDASTQTLAIIEANSSDVQHFTHVPQDVYDGLVAMVAATENPQPPTFASPKAESPDHYLTQFVKTAYDLILVTGAAADDLESMTDPTLGD